MESQDKDKPTKVAVAAAAGKGKDRDKSVKVAVVAAVSAVLVALIGIAPRIEVPDVFQETDTCASGGTPRFTTFAGKWAYYGGLAEYKSSLNRLRGLSLNAEEITRGQIEATIRIPEFKPGCKAHLIYGSTTGKGSFLTAGIGGAGSAYSIGEYDPIRGWQVLDQGGEERILEENDNYAVKLIVEDKETFLEINGVRVLRVERGAAERAKRIGLWVEGCNSAEFICFKSCS